MGCGKWGRKENTLAHEQGAMAIALDGHDGAARIPDLSNNRAHAKP